MRSNLAIRWHIGRKYFDFVLVVLLVTGCSRTLPLPQTNKISVHDEARSIIDYGKIHGLDLSKRHRISVNLAFSGGDSAEGARKYAESSGYAARAYLSPIKEHWTLTLEKSIAPTEKEIELCIAFGRNAGELFGGSYTNSLIIE